MASQPHCWIAGRWNGEWANNARYTSCTSVLQFVLEENTNLILQWLLEQKSEVTTPQRRTNLHQPSGYNIRTMSLGK